MKLFSWSTESQHEFMKKFAAGVSYELSIIMKPNFSSFGLPQNGLGYFFMP